MTKNVKRRKSGYVFEEVEKTKYLGVISTNKCEREAETREKIILCANKKLLRSKVLSKGSLMKMYKVIIRPVCMPSIYAAETPSMTPKQEEDLRIVESKINEKYIGTN